MFKNMYKVIYIEPNLKKVTSEKRRFLEKAVNKLVSKILLYAKCGIKFENIFNDDSIKYDILPNNFYTYKFQTTQFPLRLLYKVIRTEENNLIIEIHKAKFKQNNNKQYIREFTDYAVNH